jgi:multiple sugar transport system substrate-binding protein
MLSNSRRRFLRGVVIYGGAIGATSLLAACQSAPAPAKPAESKPAEAKPAEAKPAAPVSQPAPTAAPAAAKPAEAKPAAAAPAVSKKLGGELRLHMRTGPEEDTMKAVLPKFTQDTGVQVKLETFPTNEYFTKVQTLIAGGTAGDVFWGIYRSTPRFAQNKVIMQLDDLAAQDKFDLGLYWPAAVEASKYQGALYALPFKLHPGPAALYYNVKQVTEAGIKMPEKQMTSWDDLIKFGKTLTKDGRMGFQTNLSPGGAQNTPQVVNMYMRSWGTDLFSADGKKTNVNDPKGREAIRFMYDLMHTHKICVDGKGFPDQGENLMIAEKVSMLQAASSTKSIGTKIGNKFEVRNILMPVGPGGIVGTQAITDHININAKTQNKEAAWALAKLLCGKEVGTRLGGGTGGIASGTTGAMKEVFSDPVIMSNPLHPIFVDLVSSAKAPNFPANLREDEAATALHQTLMPIWLGERKPDDAFFKELETAVQSVLDRPMA